MKHLYFAAAFIAAFLAASIIAGVARNGKPGSGEANAAPVDFSREIRPILAENCFMCHGPDEKMRMARLRFDTQEGAFARPGIIIPGDSGGSEMVKRLITSEEARRMPLPASGRSLTETQIALLRRWIDEGAKWNTHWAYSAPRRYEIPDVAAKSWPRNPIDRFILARLEKEGLRPSPEAGRATLLRRLTYDLTGLPPTLEELDTFLADTADDAYEKRVEQLLRSPRYGERMTMPWLDLARYADTHGYHIDSHREMWHWRDWVIDAFNRNLPFDQFTIEQIAGDLLPEASQSQKIASGFNRNHIINFEGGAIPEEYQVEYVVDRVEATSTTWMGMTMGCARCHSHKFDPISQKEFYQFFAFFNNIAEAGLDGQTGNAKPVLPLPSHSQKARQDQLTAAIKDREAALSDKVVTPLQEAWEKERTGKIADSARHGLIAHYELDGNLSDISGGYRHGKTVRGDPTFGAGKVGKAVRFDGDTQVSFGNVYDFDRNKSFTIVFWLKGETNTPMAVLQKVDPSEGGKGYEFLLDDITLIGIQKRAARLNFRLFSQGMEKSIHIRTTERLPLSDWHHVGIRYDGTARAAGLKLTIGGAPVAVEVVRDALAGSFSTESELQVGNKLTGSPFKGQLDDLRIYSRALEDEEMRQLAEDYPVLNILSGVTGKRTAEENARLREFFLSGPAPEELRVAHRELKELKKELAELEGVIPNTMVMSEMEKPRDTFVLARGDYRNKTEKVSPGVPAILPPLPRGAPSNRLTLARWLVDPSHPLTARVVVNRFWQMYFGTGIVRTLEDFGSQGEHPVHPELLDWLATEFVRTGWDVRALQRLIVTSATYRQSSNVSAPLLEKDPDNRLLGRGPRFRLPAETVRDTILAAAGLLDSEIGGPSVYPAQPKGLWEELAFGDGFSAQTYPESTSRDLHRRSLYTFWKRTVPPPALATFDAPDREKCTSRRTVTNTPLQALALMNDPAYLEAARALAARIQKVESNNDSARLEQMFRLATARPPKAEELAIMQEFWGRQLARFQRDEEAALLISGMRAAKPELRIIPAEFAAWTMTASVILNLDETITKQ